MKNFIKQLQIDLQLFKSANHENEFLDLVNHLFLASCFREVSRLISIISKIDPAKE